MKKERQKDSQPMVVTLLEEGRHLTVPLGRPLAHSLDLIISKEEILNEKVYSRKEVGHRARWNDGVICLRILNLWALISVWDSWLPYQPMENIDESLGAADLHVVSMGSDMPGCVHPSKAYTVLAMGKPLLYLGPKESAIGQWIKDNHIGWQIDHGDVDRLRQILEIFLGMSRTERLEQSKKVLKFAENYLDRNKKLNEIQNVIESCLK